MKKKYFAGMRICLLLLAIVFAISLFFSLQQKKVFSDETIFFVVDISNSMNTKDIIAENASGKISRLDVAKLFIEKTMESEPNAYYGLVVFAQSAVTLVPATMDVGTLKDYLGSFNSNLLPGGGTDRNSLQQIFSGDYDKYSKIIFISDANVDQKLGVWAQQNMNTYFVGVGTAGGGVVRYANGNIFRFKGKNIYSSFDIQMAQSLSNQLNAKFFQIDRIDRSDRVIDEIVGDIVTFSFAQFNILLVLLALCILFLL